MTKICLVELVSNTFTLFFTVLSVSDIPSLQKQWFLVQKNKGKLQGGKNRANINSSYRITIIKGHSRESLGR